MQRVLRASTRSLAAALPTAARAAWTGVVARPVTVAAVVAATVRVVRVVPATVSPHRTFATYPSYIKLGMPALSPTMERGVIGEWKVKEGDAVKVGQLIANIQTDKATVGFDSTEDGYIAKLLYPEGADCAVGELIAVMVDSKEDVAKFKSFTGKGDAKPAAAAAPVAEKPVEKKAPAAAKKPAAPAQSYPSYIKLGMPALSPTMERGVIGEWKVKEGDAVKVGQLIANIQTDKATVGFDSTEDGYIAKLLYPDGADCAVGELIAVMVDNKEDVAKFKSFTAPGKGEPAAAKEPEVEEAEKPAASSSSSSSSSSSAKSSSGGPVFASPLARRLARERGIELSQVAGTGPNHRIVAADIAEFKAPAKAAAAATAAPAESAAARPTATAPAAAGLPAGKGDYTDIPNSNVRKVIASRLAASKRDIPHYYVSVDVNMDSAVKLRAQLNGRLEATAKAQKDAKAAKLSLNDFVIKASALALRKVPTVNSQWSPDGAFVRQFNYVDISVAVSTDGGLITPIVADADTKGLSAISNDVRDLATRARQGKLQPSEYQGGTFTISNLGMYGVKNFTAIINPPQACILAVGATEPRVVVNPAAKAGESAYATSQVMTVTLSCDHRVVDGAVGAQWLAAFKSYLEDPVSMLL